MIKTSRIAIAAAAVSAAFLAASYEAAAENDTDWMYRPNGGYEHQGYGRDNYRMRRHRQRQRERSASIAPPAEPSRAGRQNLGLPPAREVRPAPEKLEGGPRPAITPKAPPTVSFKSNYKPGTIVIDTSRRALFYILTENTAYHYPVSVGREGFQWSGTNKISRIQDWPSWHPPAEMRKREPQLPVMMTGGIYNPLGAKALYLGNTLYRIHGTNNKKSIGRAASSGCIRMLNSHVLHLASVTRIGTTVHVVNSLPRAVARTIRSSEREG
jgi:lipoprotein-anchoring transpeptidase ErfK/SrfK